MEMDTLQTATRFLFQNAKCKIQNAKCKMQNTNAKYKIQNTKYKKNLGSLGGGAAAALPHQSINCCNRCSKNGYLCSEPAHNLSAGWSTLNRGGKREEKRHQRYR